MHDPDTTHDASHHMDAASGAAPDAVPSADGAFPDGQRELLEGLPIPFAAYRYADGKVVTLLISDGLCALFHDTRANIAWRFDHDMYRYSDERDAAASAALAKRFALEGGTYEATYPERLADGTGSIMLHAVGHHAMLADGRQAAFVAYEDVSKCQDERAFDAGEADEAVTRFLDDNAFALCVIGREEPHELLYYNKAICRLIPPAMGFDTGRTFSEFFFGTDDAGVDDLLASADSPIHAWTIPTTGTTVDVGIISTSWEHQPAYLITLYERERELMGAQGQKVLEGERDRQEFSVFLNSGISNELPVWREGWQGFWIWNLTQGGRLVRESGNGFMDEEKRRGCDYESYRAFSESTTTPSAEGGEFARNATAGFFIDGFERGDWPREIELTHSLDRGLITVRSDFSMMRSPETGDLYLKIQNENVTDRTYLTRITNSAISDAYDCIAYLDGMSGTILLLTRDADGKIGRQEGYLDAYVRYLSGKVGREFATGEELLAYIADACSGDGFATVINPISRDVVKCVRMRRFEEEDQFYLSVSDVTNVVRSDRVTYYDGLTGLPNMNNFLAQCEPALSRLRHSGSEAAFVFFDIAGMRYYNDRNGYAAGNDLLKAMAKIVSRVFGGWPISRFSEDHFVVCCDREDVEERIRRVSSEVAKVSIGDLAHPLAGIYVVPKGALVDPMDACDHARAAYRSIDHRLDQVYAFYTERTLAEERQRQYVLDNLDKAIDEGWIRPYYQPVVSTADERVDHFEALARWVDPERGTLSPADFIPLLERCHLIHKVDLAIARHACADWSRRKKAGRPVVGFSINISRADFARADVVQRIAEVADRYGVPHHEMCIEITESALTDDEDYLHDQANAFHELGFPVWLDDFGSGYSSLNELSTFDFDLIKLDMKFVRSLEVDERSSKTGQVLIGSIFCTAKELGTDTLTEGVETEDQYDLLKSLGSGHIQGYLFGKPMPLEDAAAMLEREAGGGGASPEQEA